MSSPSDFPNLNDGVKIQFRRGSLARWTLKNPVLDKGEPGVVEGAKNFKIGDGVTRWNELEYFLASEDTPSNDGEVINIINAHLASLTPHTVYDDGPSLLLLYQNAKV